MRHRSRAALALFAVTMSGCYGAHGAGGPAPDGGPGGDAADVIRDCSRAVGAPAGTPCDFADTCAGGFTECGPPITTVCREGRVMHLSTICSRALPRDCSEYLAWGVPGDFCIESDFTGCVLETDRCCARSISCVGSAIVDVEACGDCEGWCAGYAPPPPHEPACTSSASCGEGTVCVPSGTPPGCGACRELPHECDADAECEDGVCVTIPADSCTCGGVAGSVCEPDCRLRDGACDADSVCTASGRCEARSCHAGWECPANTRCDLMVDRDAHGCGRVLCSTSADCDCGVCLDGACHDGPGSCRGPAA